MVNVVATDVLFILESCPGKPSTCVLLSPLLSLRYNLPSRMYCLTSSAATVQYVLFGTVRLVETFRYKCLIYQNTDGIAYAHFIR